MLFTGFLRQYRTTGSWWHCPYLLSITIHENATTDFSTRQSDGSYFLSSLFPDGLMSSWIKEKLLAQASSYPSLNSFIKETKNSRDRIQNSTVTAFMSIFGFVKYLGSNYIITLSKALHISLFYLNSNPQGTYTKGKCVRSLPPFLTCIFCVHVHVCMKVYGHICICMCTCRSNKWMSGVFLYCSLLPFWMQILTQLNWPDSTSPILGLQFWWELLPSTSPCAFSLCNHNAHFLLCCCDIKYKATWEKACILVYYSRL